MLLYAAGICDELACQELLLDYPCMVLYVGTAYYCIRKGSHIGHSAHFVQMPLLVQLLHHGNHVHRLLLCSQVAYGLVYQLVLMVVETLRAQYLCHLSEGILLVHQRTKHCCLHFQILRLAVSQRVHAWDLHHLGVCLASCFCHVLVLVYCFRVSKGNEFI